MSSIFKNPIATTFVALALLLFLIAVGFGMNWSEALQLLVVPYSYDFSHGIGRTLTRFVARGLLGLQFMCVLLAFTAPRISSAGLRRLFWGLGVILVVGYFLLMLLSYVSTGLH